MQLFLSLIILLSSGIVSAAREPFPSGKFITEWDLAFTSQEQMNAYYKANNKSTTLIVNTIGNKVFDIWNKTDRMNLTYCVSNTFGSHKKDVVEALKVATEDWMDVARVKFIYKSAEDKNCNEKNKNVVFDVRPVSLGMYLARAFFPNEGRASRNVLIDSSSFDYSFVAFSGFLRHELGHALGFRHEHISKDGNGSCDEGDTHYTPVTRYDPSSVMHYPQCGGKNQLENMVISRLDEEGARKVYP
jgi:hypothetical protein